MNQKLNDLLSKTTNPDPTTKSYAKKANNEAHKNSPFGQDEPSRKTTFK